MNNTINKNNDTIPIESDVDFSSCPPPKVGEFINVMCEDGFYPGEVIGVEKDEVHINFLTPKYKPNDAYLNEESKFWVWPDKVDHH